MRHIAGLFFIGISLLACRQVPETDPVIRLVNEWRGKEIKFPQNLIYTIQGMDTVAYSTAGKDYRILTYVDSVGCTSCKLKIGEWKNFMAFLDSATDNKVGFLFFFHPYKIRDIKAELYANHFLFPVCIDEANSMCRLNSFPEEFDYQTFLLDKQNRVVAIGNPVNNAAVKELYLDILLSRKKARVRNTEISVSTYQVDLGNIKLAEQGSASFSIWNNGNVPFVLIGIDTSCGCTKTEYSKTPVRINEQTTVRVTYTPKGTGPFQEAIVVKGNIPEPVKIVIKGIVTD